MTDNEKLTLWIGAFRYHLGRMTYAVSDFCDLLRKEWPTLPERTQSLIRKELEETFERDNKFRVMGESYAPLGGECDRREWEKVRGIWTKVPAPRGHFFSPPDEACESPNVEVSGGVKDVEESAAGIPSARL